MTTTKATRKPIAYRVGKAAAGDGSGSGDTLGGGGGRPKPNAGRLETALATYRAERRSSPAMRDLLVQTGEALFGEQWQSALARELDVAVRSVQRWTAGERDVPDVRAELRDLVTARRLRLNELDALLAD